MSRYKSLPGALKFVINALILMIFFAVVLLVGVAVYGKVIDVSFPIAWANFVAWVGSWGK